MKKGRWRGVDIVVLTVVALIACRPLLFHGRDFIWNANCAAGAVYAGLPALGNHTALLHPTKEWVKRDQRVLTVNHNDTQDCRSLCARPVEQNRFFQRQRGTF